MQVVLTYNLDRTCSQVIHQFGQRNEVVGLTHALTVSLQSDHSLNHFCSNLQDFYRFACASQKMISNKNI